MKLEASLYRDGTSQRDRLSAALLPDYFVVDDRTLADLIEFSQQCAPMLCFYEDPDPHKAPSDWTGFLSNNRAFIEDAVRFIEQPEAIVDANRRAELSQPHRVLFWVFLLLLRYPQQQFNALTQRYLEFYYRDCLQLQEKPPQPDQAPVIFELAPFQPPHLLKKGTLLRAGNPHSTGTPPPLYRLDNDIMVSAAQVAQICTVTLKKEPRQLETIYHQGKNKDDDFKEMLEWVLNRAAQQVTGSQEELPPLEMAQLKTWAAQKPTEDKVEEPLLKKLGFPTIEDFKACLHWHTQSGELQQIYAVMKLIYQKKILHHRYVALKNHHRHHPDFIALLQLAFGKSLPAWPGQHPDISGWPDDLSDEKVVNYIKQQLGMEGADFRAIIDTVNQRLKLDDAKWKAVYQSLARAQTKKKGYPDIQTEEITDIVTRQIWDRPSGADFTPFNGFDWPDAPPHETEVGFAIQSPILFLQEGKRDITLTIDCQPEGFDSGQLNQCLQKAPLRVQLSSAQTWLTPTKTTVSAGTFLLGQSLAEYESDKLELLCRFKESPESLRKDEEKTHTFNTGDKNHYLRFEDGQLYQITEVIDKKTAKLKPAGFLPGKGNIKKYEALALTGTVETLSGVKLHLASTDKLKNNKNVKKITAQASQFKQAHVGQYLLWTEGTVYVIQSFVNAREVEVIEYAHLPSLTYEQVRLYKEIKFDKAEVITGLAITGAAIKEGYTFTPEEVGQVLVWDNGTMFTIEQWQNDKKVDITRVGQSLRAHKIKKYATGALFLNGLQLTVTLDDTEPAITAPKISDDPHGLPRSSPIIKITLKSGRDYDVLKTLAVKKATLSVRVTGVKSLTLRNDESPLNRGTLLQPFGHFPTAHTGFYFAHPEICNQALDTLTLQITWSGLPESFEHHYKTYRPFLKQKIDNRSFQAQLTRVEGRTETAVGSPQCLFASDTGGKVDPHTHLAFTFPQRRHTQETSHITLDDLDDDLMNWPGYFKLALTEPDFLHGLYPAVLSQSALARLTESESKTEDPRPFVSAPYTPMIRDLTLDYTASSPLDLSDSARPTTGNATELFQLHPFGHRAVSHQVNSLLPHFSRAGYLYMGLKDAAVSTPLSLLFQLRPNPSDRLEDKISVQYQYLGQDNWQAFNATTALKDKTGGLMRSGMVSFQLPESASQTNPIMPTGLHWVGLTVDQKVLSPQIVAIQTQAASVTLAQEMPDEHYHHPLPAYRIYQLVTADPKIVSVTQPYASSGARPGENAHRFWQRTSERLRHKQRAVSCWDYERLVLEAFPQIYKVKCLTHTQLQDAPLAQVTVVVVPSRTEESGPAVLLRPKAPRHLLEDIQAYLNQYVSPFVNLKVTNPRYEQIQYRVAVRFKKSWEQSDYRAQLNQALRHFLSPWADEQTAEVNFGSHIHHSLLIHFIEKQPYVDYVTQLKLIEHRALDENITYPLLNVEKAQVHAPDAILVSAPEHLIDFVTDSQHQNLYFEGIGYLRIGQDFIVH